MNRTTAHLLAALLCLALVPAAAIAGPCDAHYRFDGDLVDSSGNGNDGQMLTKEGALGRPDFVAGHSGQALKLDGTKAMRAFLDLSYRKCPQVTFTAWVNVEPAPNQMIFGMSSAQYVMASNSTLIARAGGKDTSARNAVMSNAGWLFIAASWDAQTKKVTLHWRGRSIDGVIGDSQREADPSIWLGALDSRLAFAARQLVIDDVRIVGEVLDHERIMALQNTKPAVAIAATGSDRRATDSGMTGSDRRSSESGATTASCAAAGDCAAGFYCGVDNLCYPDSQRPMESAAATSSGTGSVPTGRLGGTFRPPPTIGGIERPDLGPRLQPSGLGTIKPVASFGDGLAGRWQHFESNDSSMPGAGAAIAVTLDLRGPDTALVGHIWIDAMSMFGPINEDEPLSSVNRNGDIISLSSPSLGTVSGQVASDNNSMTLSDAGQNMTLALQRVSTSGDFATDTSQLMAGSWSHLTQGQSGGLIPSSSVGLTFEFTGYDAALSGKMIVTGQAFGAPINQEESLRNIVVQDRAISFSTLSSGSFSGEVSADGTTMTLVSDDSSRAAAIVLSKN